MKKYIIMILITVSPTLLLFAQQTTIKAKIVDKITNEPIVGANIIIENTDNGTFSNEIGDFELENVNITDLITISFLGYKSQKIKISKIMRIIYLEDSGDILDEVVVSTSRTKKRRQDVPVAISTITAKTLNEIKPSSVDQVLNQSAGVLMVDLGNEQHMMAIRQPITTKSLFLYLEDGVPIRPTGVFNHNALLEMNMAATKNIEIIRGPFSSLYGSEAIGGAINFILANPTITPTGSFSIRRNEHGYLRMDAKASTTFGKLGVYVSGYKSQIKDGIRQYGDYDKEALTTKLTYRFNDNTYWSNTLTYVNYFSEMSGSIDEVKFKNKDYSSDHTFTFRDAKSLRFNSTLKHNWNENNNTSASLFYRDNSMAQNPSYRISSRTKNNSYTRGQLNENSFNSYGIVIQHNIKLSKFELNLGTSLDYSPNTYDIQELSVFRNNLGIFESYSVTGKVLANYAVDIFSIGGYLSGEYSFTEKFKANAALRIDRFNYDFTNRLGVDAADYVAPDTENSFTAVTPRLGLVYNFNKNLAIYSNYSNGFLPPSVGQLYRKSDVPLLDPSKFNNYEVGSWLSFLDNKLYIDVAAYYLLGKDEIVSFENVDGVRENVNAGETEHYGFEYLLKVEPIKNVNISFAGSYSKHKFIDYVENNKDFSDNEMPGAPAWVNNAQLKYKPKFIKGLRLGMEWQHVGSYFTDEVNENTYGGYDTFNARIGFKKGHWHLWMDLLNINDKLYANRASTGYGRTKYTPGTPRTFNLGLEINLF